MSLTVTGTMSACRLIVVSYPRSAFVVYHLCVHLVSVFFFPGGGIDYDRGLF